MVAIKILPPELAISEVFSKSFEAEGKAMAKVSHPNLVGVFDLGEISDMLFLVIKYVEGSNLHESKGDSAIDPETAVTLIRSVASGLAEAHRLGMVHRDIKPANILINTDLVPKLGERASDEIESVEQGIVDVLVDRMFSIVP
ncbi:protein kinase [Akkermansiaceae bacterium]|nr:protein kinase [Akkermansiaceae bacterium]MDB4319447.1 protein kinase [bacterium]MDB4265949.1 protein kinase [Akkermansiaceae bacterium]MDB4309846.1 protein kinase [Akkermansiaceae bacterium]MDB4433894.1 protein kinase [Akkermansiaceae bacterium]